MTASLTFTIPEEDLEFTHARQGARLAGVVSDFDQWLRGLAKHTDPDKHPSVDDIRSELRRLTQSAGVVLYD